jgi:hypothetical protein
MLTALGFEIAMNKLEKVALRYSRKNGRPLVLIFNNVHYFDNNDEARALLQQLQQVSLLYHLVFGMTHDRLVIWIAR